jgi:hypothetical protein
MIMPKKPVDVLCIREIVCMWTHEPYVIAARKQNPSEKSSQMPLCCSQNTGHNSKGINVGRAKRVGWGGCE